MAFHSLGAYTNMSIKYSNSFRFLFCFILVLISMVRVFATWLLKYPKLNWHGRLEAMKNVRLAYSVSGNKCLRRGRTIKIWGSGESWLLSTVIEKRTPSCIWCRNGKRLTDSEYPYRIVFSQLLSFLFSYKLVTVQGI